MAADKVDLNALKIDREEHTPRVRRGGGAVWGTVVTLVVVAALFLAGWLAWQKLIAPPREVKLVAAEMRSPSEARSLLSGSGYVVAQRKADVASKATGLLVQLDVKEGDALKRNQVIARLEDNDIRAALAEAQAQLALNEADLEQARNNLDRQKRLAQGGANAYVDVEGAVAAYNRVLAAIEIARARVDAARVALENTVIRAPFDGTVLTKNADVGEMVAPFAAGAGSRAAVVTLADLSSLEVEADVSESNIEKIKLGAPCEIRLDAYPTYSYPGYVASIIPTADRSKGTVMVKIGFREYDERVLPEMSAKVTFLTGEGDQPAKPQQTVLTVPTGSVVERGGRTVVLRVEDKRVVEYPVEAGAKFGSYTEIRAGLERGDRVIQDVPADLAAGAKVEVK